GGECLTGGDVGEGRLDLGGEVAVGTRAGDVGTQAVADSRGGRCGGQRGAQVERAGGGEELDGDHAGETVDGTPQLARRGPAHGHMVLLHGAGGYGVDRGRGGQPLELGDDRGLRVLGDHVAGVHARVVGEEGGQAVVAGRIQ